MAGANSRHRAHAKRFESAAAMADDDAFCVRIQKTRQKRTVDLKTHGAYMLD